MRTVNIAGPLPYSSAAPFNGSSSSIGELQSCYPTNELQDPTSAKGIFGSWSRKGAVMASLRRLGSAFGLDKLARKSRGQQSRKLNTHTAASSVHGGSHHRNFADGIIMTSRLQHSSSNLNFAQFDDPSIRTAPASPMHSHSCVTSATATPTTDTAARPEATPPCNIDIRRLPSSSISTQPSGPPMNPQPATQSAPTRSIHVSYMLEQLPPVQHGRALVSCDLNGVTATALNLEACLSAPPKLAELQQACADAASEAAAAVTGHYQKEQQQRQQPVLLELPEAAAVAAAKTVAQCPDANPGQKEPQVEPSAQAEQTDGGAQQQQKQSQQAFFHQRQQPDESQQQQQVAQGAASPACSMPVHAQGVDSFEPGMLLGTARALPPGMCRSDWSISDYTITKRLFKTARSAVYKAVCKRSGVPVALKVYFLTRVPTNTLHQIAREIQIQLSLDHKNVLALYGAFQDSRRLVMVMELAARGDLFNLKSAMERPLTEEQLQLVVLEPLLDALSYLHSKGICHRDLKPENLLFTSDWGIRLADFGVSINLLEERAVTRAGTADYMAPEVVRCPLKSCPEDNKENTSLAYTTAVDVWSVGVLAYELLVGFPPVVVDSAGHVVPGIDRSMISFPASVSPGARDFITCALAQLPEERPTVRQLRCHPWMLDAGTSQ